MKTKGIVGRIMVAIPIIWLVVAALTSLVMTIPNNFSWEPEFNRNVHGHTENAYHAGTPELIVTELKAAVKGMHDLGLEPGLYGDMRPWKQTPDNRMDYQSSQMQSVIDRAQAIIAGGWCNSSSARTPDQGNQINDVCGQKIREVKSLIVYTGSGDCGWSSNSCWIDNLAKQAYLVEYHPFYAGWYDFSAVVAGAWFSSVVFLLIPGAILWTRASDE